MRFAKVFDIEGTQLLCVLQPRDEDGLPEIRMITYVGGACITFGNRLTTPDEKITDPNALLQKTQEIFNEFGQADAEEAYKLARKVVGEAARRKSAENAENAAGDDLPGVDALEQMTDSDFNVPLVSTALH